VKKRQKPRKPKRSPQRAPALQASPDKESTAEEWEAETPEETVALEREWEGLPDSDEETKVVLLPVNPYLVHVYWGIAPHDVDVLERVFRRPGPRAQPVLRFYEISQAIFDATNAPGQFDVEIDLQAGNWYVHLENPAKSYCIDLGLRTAGGGFHRLARSNVAETARAWVSDKVDESYLLVTGGYSQVEKVAASVERGEATKTPAEALEVGKPASTEENKTGPTEGGISRPVAATVSAGEVTPVVKAPTGTAYAGPPQGGEERGPEAKELRRFRKVTPGEIERKVAELFRPPGWEWPGLTAKASGVGEPRPSGKERADLTLLSEESFRTGISSGGK
jgi:hypothetical protein